MFAVSQEREASIVDVKQQTASRRAASLSRSRADYSKQSQVSSAGRKASAGPAGSDFAVPHRAARVATRSLLAKGCVAGSSDMPQISMGCAGTWQRWIRKPSVSKMGSVEIEDLDMIGSLLGNSSVDWQESACDDYTSLSHHIHGTSAPFDVQLDDEIAFPTLASTPTKPALNSECKSQSCSQEVAEDLTPEKVLQAEDDVPMDWVVVPANEAAKTSKTPSAGAAEIFDTQHPRNMFAKKSTLKAVELKDDSQDAGHGIDWSKAGMPIELISRLLRGCANPAHHGLHSQKKVSTVPSHVMRAQNVGSSKRQSSTPKTPPRSQSKPRAMKQSTNRH